MSRTGNWVLEMQEDAYHMSLGEFISKHGFSQAEVWHDINFGDDRDREPDLEAMEEGYYGS